MRKLIYKIASGKTVSTLHEAEASGLPYEIDFEEIKEEGLPLSTKRKELIEKFGFVPPKK